MLMSNKKLISNLPTNMYMYIYFLTAYPTTVTRLLEPAISDIMYILDTSPFKLKLRDRNVNLPKMEIEAP